MSSHLAMRKNREQLSDLAAAGDREAIHQTVFELAASDVKQIPGTTITHLLMVERLAYVYSKSVMLGQVQNEPNAEPVPYHVERAWLQSFNQLCQELGRETRTLLREESFRETTIESVIQVLRAEMIDHPELLERVADRLEEV